MAYLNVISEVSLHIVFSILCEFLKMIVLGRIMHVSALSELCIFVSAAEGETT